MYKIRTLFAVLIATSAVLASAEAVPVKFPKGSSTTTLKGSIKGDAFVDYSIKAQAGQTLSLRLKSSNSQAYMNLLPAGSEEATFVGSTSGSRFKGILPDDGAYRVRVYLMRPAARRGESSKYSLTVSLTGKGLQPIATSKDALVPGTRFNAQASVDCKLDLFPEVKRIDAFVVRRGVGAATVELRASGITRHILFVKGKAVASDSPAKLKVVRKGDVSIVSLDRFESYSIPDALVLGG